MPEICTIIGNGTSLKRVSKTFLDKYPTFGSNRIYLHYIPTFYVCVNQLVLEQNIEEIRVLECAKYLRVGFAQDGDFALNKNASVPFSLQPLKFINEGYNVTYVCLQLARFMDFKTVLLVGVDHRYKFDGKPNEVGEMQEDDPNHFDPEYFKGQKWQMPDLKRSEEYFKIAESVFKKEGRRIINLTPRTALDVFEKGKLSEWN